jgi:MFS family permease
MKLQKEKITDTQRKKLYRQAITSQTLGMQGIMAFSNGILLLYMTMLGISPAKTITYLSLPVAISVVLRLPVAYRLDQIGGRKIGIFGVFLTAIGFTIIPIGGFFPLKQAEYIILTGIVILAIGKTFFAPTWLPIIDGFINPDKRGSFFARLRLTIQLTGLGVSALTAWFIKDNAPLSKYIIILFILAGCLYGRWYYYAKIPEIVSKKTKPPSAGFFKSLKEIMSNGDFTSFCLYVFLFSLFTAGCGTLFSLVEKNVVGLSGSTIILLTNTSTIGGILGLSIGGKIIDKYGSKFAFLFCHLGFVGTIAIFLGRNMILTPIILIGLAHFAIGLLTAFSGLARSTETLALIPEHNKALSTSFAMSLTLGAQSLSGLMSAWAISLNLINSDWTFFGKVMSNFDGILLIYGVMTFLMILALSLVPSVVRKATWGAIAN